MWTHFGFRALPQAFYRYKVSFLPSAPTCASQISLSQPNLSLLLSHHLLHPSYQVSSSLCSFSSSLCSFLASLFTASPPFFVLPTGFPYLFLRFFPSDTPPPAAAILLSAPARSERLRAFGFDLPRQVVEGLRSKQLALPMAKAIVRSGWLLIYRVFEEIPQNHGESAWSPRPPPVAQSPVGRLLAAKVASGFNETLRREARTYGEPKTYQTACYGGSCPAVWHRFHCRPE